MPDIGAWDIALVGVVSVHATVLAYLHHPRLKALVYTLPVPFTIACLALGRPVGVTHMLGLPVLLVFTNGVRWLHVHGHVPIIPAIVLSALAYSGCGVFLARVVPAESGPVFWCAMAGTMLGGAILHFGLSHRVEPGHRSPLPIAFKFLIVAAVVSVLVMVKQQLQGFMSFFPMVGVVAAHEARHSLWTLGRQIPVLMLAMPPMLAVCRLTQARIGLGPALALGWPVYLILLALLTWRMWRQLPVAP